MCFFSLSVPSGTVIDRDACKTRPSVRVSVDAARSKQKPADRGGLKRCAK